jgi:ATP-dependent Clp protease protease subunit
MVMRLDQKVHPDGIHLYMTSPGGAGTAGLALYDFLKNRKNDITIIAHGECSSVAALILQSADRRIISPHTRMLLHFGMVDMGNKGNVGGVAMQTAATEVMRLDATFLDILCERATCTRAVLETILKADSFLHSPDIIHLGLADEVTYSPAYKR